MVYHINFCQICLSPVEISRMKRMDDSVVVRYKCCEHNAIVPHFLETSDEMDTDEDEQLMVAAAMEAEDNEFNEFCDSLAQSTVDDDQQEVNFLDPENPETSIKKRMARFAAPEKYTAVRRPPPSAVASTTPTGAAASAAWVPPSPDHPSALGQFYTTPERTIFAPLIPEAKRPSYSYSCTACFRSTSSAKCLFPKSK